MRDPRAFLTSLFQTAVDAAAPALAITKFLPERPRGRTIVVGAGKAAASMAAAVEAVWDGPLEGMVVTRYGHGFATSRIEVVEAAHPVPDAQGERAARRMLALVQGLTPDDLVLCLISGGGSALLSAPAPGLTLDDKQAINRALLASGAGIAEMNCVRKHLSAIKGGRLAAAAAPARVVSLVISDVPGDDLAVIASGPTVPDPDHVGRRAGDPRRLPDRRLASRPRASRQPRVRNAKARRSSRSRAIDNRLIAAPALSLRAAAALAREQGVEPLLLGDAIEGEAREVGKAFAGLALGCRRLGEPARPPCVLLSGGETTVTVRGLGAGRAQLRVCARAGARAGRRGGSLCACRRH